MERLAQVGLAERADRQSRFKDVGGDQWDLPELDDAGMSVIMVTERNVLPFFPISPSIWTMDRARDLYPVQFSEERRR